LLYVFSCLQSKEGIEQLKSQPTAWTAFVFLVPSVLNTDLTKQAADVISRAVETMKEIKEVIAVSLVKDCKVRFTSDALLFHLSTS
jgi:hypothetical protein